ncbi:DUF4856 domain-containing protein [Tamlana sp. 2_MG-2023]|uniref:DUF4856 domain-containing protein n=1 Tax=unclassified Tamlana TaxID=2614803 RepID=UPI0026E41F63|nr:MULTISPECIES: DUF4856 domain-containing protein [unclassified Tamlana]MDO6758806.1 DUF4856 domain-containing protein [Tamlana sp. 2_MG-2023]MDO6789505.1 DUF4856 domain-containing protein [Tamlana sp. 1_MG-2023]
MKKLVLSLFVVSALFQSCSSDDDSGDNGNNVVAPATYVFEREGSSTVSFSGQTTRIQMAEEIVTALKDNGSTEAQIDAMFAHVENGDDFSNSDLNASDKSVRSKVAASTDYFSANSTEANAIKDDFDTWISEQVDVVFQSWNDVAAEGKAGAILQANGTTIRYVNAEGLEYNQAFAKGLIGGLMIDQILNNYLSTSVLDAGENIENNDAEVLESGKNYTTMEHKWDEAYGYLFGNEANPAVPELGADQFLSEYLDRVSSDPDFEGLDVDVYNAFKLGRAAITEGEYTVRDEQVEILRESISLVPAVRAVYYLQAGKNNLAADKGSAFHALSEAYGFIYSLQFTRDIATDGPYFTKAEVDGMLADLMGDNGFWGVSEATLDELSDDISARFGFTTEAAADASN